VEAGDLFHLFGEKIMRFSDLERAIPAITQKMLGQQLKQWRLMALFYGLPMRKCRLKWNTA